MKRSLLAALVAVAIGAGLQLRPGGPTARANPAVGAPDTGLELLEIGVWDVPLTLAPSLEFRRDLYGVFVRSGQRRIRDFSRRYKWQRHTSTPLVRSVAIYDDKEDFDLAAARLIGASPTRIPRTRVAAERRGELAMVAPDVYRELAAEGIETDSYEKLVAHELAHVLHGRILDGAEELAGPLWFYEGFAVYAAGQFEVLQQEPTHDEIVRVVQGAEPGNQRLAGGVLRYYARRVPLQELVKRAGQANFRSWLLQIALAGVK